MTEPRPGPLTGYRVLELTTTVSGPMTGMTLADQGAEVIKIEPPMIGDTARFLGPSRGGFAALWLALNRNKRSIALDLKDEEQHAIFLKLVESADVLLENYRPGVLDRLGLGYEALSAIRPELVYATITGYGDGPYHNRRVYDPLIQATSGTAWAQGDGGDPTNVRTIIFDKVTALTTAQGITAALLERERTGTGQHLPITMLESALSYQWADVMWSQTLVGDDVAEAPGELADWFPVFRAKDGFVSMTFVADPTVELFSIWRGAELHTDPRFATFAARYANRREFVAEINRLLADVEIDECCEMLDAMGIPVARVNSLDEVRADPQVEHLGAVIETEHPDAGPMRLARPPVPFGGVRETAATFPRNPAPRLGQDSAELLGALDVAPETIAALVERDAANAEILKAMIETEAAAE